MKYVIILKTAHNDKKKFLTNDLTDDVVFNDASPINWYKGRWSDSSPDKMMRIAIPRENILYIKDLDFEDSHDEEEVDGQPKLFRDNEKWGQEISVQELIEKKRREITNRLNLQTRQMTRKEDESETKRDLEKIKESIRKLENGE